jgi:hypothetical protein
MLASALLTALAFHHIFQRPREGENDLRVIQRQIRGFALLMVSNIVMILGMMLCAGSLLPSVVALLR